MEFWTGSALARSGDARTSRLGWRRRGRRRRGRRGGRGGDGGGAARARRSTSAHKGARSREVTELPYACTRPGPMHARAHGGQA
eukprot:5245703-Prymnesium_polylepis.1